MAKSNSRSKNSLLNAITAMIMTMANGLLGIVVTRFVVASFGSDFNGLNSTANQIVNVLLVLEGGFTLASNVALFKPFSDQDYGLVNGILTATRAKFRKIGLVFLVIGAVISVGYGFAVNSALPTEFIITVILMTVVPAAFNLFYATTYRVLLQTQQKEYVINVITICTISLGHIANIVMILAGGPMWMVRFNTMVCSLLNSLLIAFYVKKKAPYLDFSVEPRSENIRGTNDVMIQKLTGVVYSSAPIVFLSLSPSGGTALASVYAVYNSVFTMLKSLLHGFIDAPRLSLGQLLTKSERDEVWPVFAQYEYAAFSAVFVMLSTCSVLIMPFIGIYMDGITDANYMDVWIAVFMVLITVIEMLHIPSGHLINMAGHFRVSKNFQIISCVVLFVSMLVGGLVWGVYGMLAAILLVAILLAIMEMGYVHTRFFKRKLSTLMRMLLPLCVIGAAVSFLELQIPFQITGYLSFLLCGVVLVLLNGVIALAVGLVFNRVEVKALWNRFWRILKRV